MTLTESLACGTPVVASRHGGGGEIVSSPDIGRTVDILEESDLDSEARARELADAVLETFALSTKSQTRSRCREWSARWSLERVGAQEERFLEEIVETQVTNHARRPVPSGVAR
jgi:glycosyltransferase involved in cell wall biosynthesis